MTDFSNIIAIIMAGGKGKRMKSDMPKVLHPLAGKPIIKHITDTLKPLKFQKIVLVVGYGRDQVTTLYLHDQVEFAIQNQQLGTGDAVKSAEPYFRDFDGLVMVINGDVPLLTRGTLAQMVDEHLKRGVTATVLTSIPDDPAGYGRVIRDESGFIKKIVESADATPEELQIREINTGIYLFDARALVNALSRIDRQNAQGEYYITDVVKILLDAGKKNGAVLLSDYREALGVNSVEQLNELEAIYEKKELQKH